MLMTIGEAKNKDQLVNLHDGPARARITADADPPVDLSLHLPLTGEQDLKELLHLGQDLLPDPEKG